jgi:PAS domain S-box-containing protein
LEAQVHQRTKELIVANEQLHYEALERIRNQDLLKETNSRLKNIMESMTDGFVALDNEWRYTYINSAAAQYFNRQPSELLGKICWEEFPASKQSAAYGDIMRSKEENRFLSFEAAAGDSPVRWYENRCYPSPDGMTIYFNEITEQKNLERARHNLIEYEEKIQEQERLALSREVHDEIGQDLTAFKLDLNWIERRLPPESRELTERIIEMRENLGQLINVARNITSRLRPPLLDNLGLVAATEWQINDFKKRSGLKCQFDSNIEIEITDELISSSLLRILKESLSNILRHANATEVGISLYQKEDRIVLEVADNGDGVTDDRVNSNISFGIMGMRERSQLCGGSLSVKGKSGEGTKVCCTIPLPGRVNT